MAHTSDFSKSAEQILLDLINATNHSNLPLSAVSIVKGQDLPAGRSTAVASSNSGSGYRGNQTFNYAQVNVGQAFPVFTGTGKIIPAAGVPNTLHGILNAALGIQLKSEDLLAYVGASQPNFSEGNVNVIKITAADISLIWDGTVDIEIATYKVNDVLSYRVRLANSAAGYGVMPAATAYDNAGRVMLSEDGKVIVGG